MRTASQIGRARSRIGTVLVSLLGVVLIASGAAKFAEVPKVVEQLGAMGIVSWRLFFVAGLELISALLFLVPSTRSFGLLMVSAFLGGAIATHLEHGQAIAQPAVFLTLLWLGAWLRHPEILWSFARRDEASSVASTARKTAAA